MRYKLQHLGVCDTLDVSIDLIRDNFKKLFPAFAAMYLPLAIFLGLAMIALIPQPPAGAKREEQIRAGQEVIAWLPLFYLLLFAQMIATAFVSFLMVPTIASIYLGEPISVRSGIRSALSRPFALLSLTIFLVVPTTIGMGCCFLGAVYFLIFGFSVHVMLLEGRGTLNSPGRAYRSVSRDWQKGLGIYVMAAIIMYILTLTQMVIIEMHLRVIIGACIMAALYLWFMAVMTVYYYSCRCELECFDLYHLANSIKPSPDDDSPAASLPFAFN